MKKVTLFAMASAIPILLLITTCQQHVKIDDIIYRFVDNSRLSIKVMGFETSMVETPTDRVEIDKTDYDVIIVGGGLSGLCSAWYLRHKKILILERKETAGGLAFRGITREGIAYARGSAYYSKPRKQVEQIYKELNMSPLEQTVIPEPIDSYFYGKKLIKGVWEEEALKELPQGFRKFKEALLKADEKGLVPEQPIEEASNLSLDKITAAEFIKPFGQEVKDFLDSYAQSALGSKTDDLNALAFCNFYLAEIETRYAWPGGTAGASVHLIEQLNKFNRSIIKTSATVTHIKNINEGVQVAYSYNGRNYKAEAKYAILAVPLAVSSYIMEDYPQERKQLVSKLQYADYIVHQFFISKDIFKDSYDTWFANLSFTDVITARWVETKGFTKEPLQKGGILSVYQPLAPYRKIQGFTAEIVADLATRSFIELKPFIPDLANERSIAVESYRWPKSIHIVPPRFFSEITPKLCEPVKRIYFAGNNLGTPSFEEALYRGWRAANEILKFLASAPSKNEYGCLSKKTLAA